MDRVRGRETTSSMARRSQDSLWTVLGAVNADFFESDGESVSHQIAGGTIVQAATRGQNARVPIRSQFAFTPGKRCLIEKFGYQGKAVFPSGEILPVLSVNRWRRTAGLVAFNRFAVREEPVDTSAARVGELRLRYAATRADTVLYVPADEIEDLAFRWLEDSLRVPLPRPADTVRVVHTFVPDPGPLSLLVGGLPRLVVDGRSVADRDEYREGSSRDFATKRHPRTGVGFSADSTRLYLVTVDGRQEASVGMSLPEFADLLISLGVYQGLNFDGGGSTTMVAGGAVVNSPSDLAGERAVSNALLVLARRQMPDRDAP